jgi:hypothetical protein
LTWLYLPAYNINLYTAPATLPRFRRREGNGDYNKLIIVSASETITPRQNDVARVSG